MTVGLRSIDLRLNVRKYQCELESAYEHGESCLVTYIQGPGDCPPHHRACQQSAEEDAGGILHRIPKESVIHRIFLQVENCFCQYVFIQLTKML